MRMLLAMTVLTTPVAAAAAMPGNVAPGDGLLLLGGLAIAALISRRRRGLPESCD